MRPADTYTSQSTLVPILCAFALGLFGLHVYTFLYKIFKTCPPPPQEQNKDREVTTYDDKQPAPVLLHRQADGTFSQVPAHQEQATHELEAFSTSENPYVEHRKRRFRHAPLPPHRRPHWYHRVPRHRVPPYHRRFFRSERSTLTCASQHALSLPSGSIQRSLTHHPLSPEHRFVSCVLLPSYRMQTLRFEDSFYHNLHQAQ